MTRPAIRLATVADAPALAALFVEGWRDEHAGLLPEDILATRSLAESETNWRRSLGQGEETGDPIVLVAGEPPFAGQIVGVLQARERPGAAEVSLVQVARASQRRGIGAALMRGAAARLADRGAKAIIVRVLEANARARRFYEALGGELAADLRQVEESGFSFPERTYVWREIGRLAGGR